MRQIYQHFRIIKILNMTEQYRLGALKDHIIYHKQTIISFPSNFTTIGWFYPNKQTKKIKKGNTTNQEGSLTERDYIL